VPICYNNCNFRPVPHLKDQISPIAIFFSIVRAPTHFQDEPKFK